MSMSAAEELPEEFRRTLSEQAKQDPAHAEPQVLAEEQPRLAEPASTGWLFIGMLLVVAVGVLLLVIFASGGNADESLML
jgi:cytochrome c-type biogenesis protein CcmH/NrfG